MKCLVRYTYVEGIDGIDGILYGKAVDDYDCL